GTDPMAGKAVEFSREEFDVTTGRFSADGRLMAYLSNESDPEKLDVYVRPFDASSGVAGSGKWRVTKEGASGMVYWRADGKEMYYLKPNIETSDAIVMAVDLATAPSFQAGASKELFRLPGPLRGNPMQWKN